MQRLIVHALKEKDGFLLGIVIKVKANMPPKQTQKKLSKAKEKKLKRKQEQAEIALLLKKIKSANEVEDYMVHFAPFKTYSQNGLNAKISYGSPANTSPDDLQWMFQLLKDNMEEIYRSNDFRWKDREKFEELSHESSRYLIARDAISEKPLGFVSLRFDLDDDVDVVYCYEIQLSVDARRKGLGKFLMQLLELIGHKANMTKIVLTVFKDNLASNHFFREKLRYKEDDTSPLFFDPMNPDDYTYSIISKELLLGGGKVDKQIKKTAAPETVLTNTTNTTNTN
ncbi:PREDICTED: N-alpha-acetyltransferase 40-like [Amphimedon queenslandica]|uniref:N-alpha-acetyltransferase 40 n=1 Tax=Amphimedon queenslandica TaxID=400682 RepID=A0A1X7UMZ0_AMPQE|nr:PREDICTED: N-alpha-acetyltransferase 40-like [Amphimedon queenslandica]|eukprot:XP_019853278.1 PREDICTED: N-alpha-acetyltransferase 40-like [Amphimedon queenslandica]